MAENQGGYSPMKERKLKEDYGLQTQIDEKGREKQVPVYRGEWFILKEKSSKSALYSLVPGCLLFLIPLIIYLFGASPSTYCLYVLIPAIAALLPAVYLAGGLFRMYGAPSPMTKLRKETGIGRVLRSSFGCMLLTGAALAGDLIFLLLNSDARNSEWACACLFLLSFAGILMVFVRSRKIWHGIEPVRKEDRPVVPADAEKP